MLTKQLPLFYSFPIALVSVLGIATSSVNAEPKAISAELAPILEKGYNQLKDGNNTNAVSTLKDAIKVDKDSITARRYLAYALIKDKHPVDAIKQLNLIVNKLNKPTYFEWCTFGEAYLAAGGVQQAQNCFEQAKKIAPSSHYVKSGLIRTSVKSGQYQDALGLAKEGMKNSKNPETYDYFKNLYMKVRMIELAKGGSSSSSEDDSVPPPSTATNPNVSPEFIKRQREFHKREMAKAKQRNSKMLRR